ncbi:unnamed protein product [Symbiodinium natans]|uniref:Uncharacterized protein n=1 Tax=Symbiodinium natans TaxID=878477 RepID=A0A812P5E1_9DINO|nr:unnamed protein product [Symbiodinium natans]
MCDDGVEVASPASSDRKWVRTDEGLWSPHPRKPDHLRLGGDKALRESFDSDEVPRRQMSTFSRQTTFSRQQSTLSNPFSEMDLDFQEVVRQLSEAQEAAAEAQRQAAEAEAKHARAEAALAKEAEAAAKRKEKAAAILEEARQKRLSQQKARGREAEKGEKGEKADSKPRKAEAAAEADKKPPPSSAKLLSVPSTKVITRQGHRGGPSMSPKGIKTSFKTKRESSRSCTRKNQEAEAAALRAAAEKRKKDLAAVLQKASEEAVERERIHGGVLTSHRSLEARLEESEAARAQLAQEVERLTFQWEDLRSRQTVAVCGPAKSMPDNWRSESEISDSSPLLKKRVRRTTGAIFVFLMAVAGSALHLTRLGAQPPQPPCARGLRR